MTLKSAFYNRCYGGRKPQWERGSSERSLLELYRAPYVQRLATLAYELVTACSQPSLCSLASSVTATTIS